jgi:hypothetical protein
MPVEVVVAPDPVRGPSLGSSSSKFGVTTLDEIRVMGVRSECSPVAPRSTDCRCRLRRVDLRATCIVRLNPARIARAFFDPDPDNPRGYTGRRENGRYVPESPDHIPLDEESVLIHEWSHCRDIADAIQAAVKQALDANEAGLFAFCPCNRPSLCDETLLRMVRDRVRALGTDAYRDLLRDAARHGTGSETEARARRAQIDDFRTREEEGGDGD